MQENYKLEIIEPGIIRLSAKPFVEIDEAMALEMIEEAQRLANDESYAILFVAPDAGSISPEGRTVFSRSKKRSALAIVSNSIVSRLIGNFFVKFNKPATPSALFSTEEEALAWLHDR